MATKKKPLVYKLYVAGCANIQQHLDGVTAGENVEHKFISHTLKGVKTTFEENEPDQMGIENGDILYEVTIKPIHKINTGITLEDI